MDGFTITNVSDTKNSDASILNSPAKIIIKKENIGLHEHQHQKYQYSLFNHNEKRDQFYEDLNKMKDRLEKAAPNMQQVIHMDMKRANTNKLYERKLSRELTGPRGLNWQCKQELQRLLNNEREAERDLIRLNRDLARVSISSLTTKQSSPRHSINSSRSQTARLSIPMYSHLPIQIPERTKVLLERPLTINTNRTITDRLTSIKPNSSIEKSFRMSKKLHTKSTGTRHHHHTHAKSINQQKREIEQKLKDFLH